jgi:hypothetical protein
VDHRVKPGDDDHYESRCQHAATDSMNRTAVRTSLAIHVCGSHGSARRGCVMPGSSPGMTYGDASNQLEIVPSLFLQGIYRHYFSSEDGRMVLLITQYDMNMSKL